MKVLVIFAFLLVASNALDKEFVQKMKQVMQEIGAQCVEQESPGDDDIALLISHQLPQTHEGKCVIYCVYKHFNTIEEDGTINVDAGVKALQPLKENDEPLFEKVVAIFKKCANSVTNDGDPCNTATNLIGCAMEEGKAAGLSEDLFE